MPPLLDPAQASALRAFLRSCRARRPADLDDRISVARQRDVASAARLSLSFYKRLEAGAAGSVSMDVLHRVADALRLDPAATARLVALARPDLAMLSNYADHPTATGQLRDLRTVTAALIDSPDSESAQRLAVRSLPGLLGRGELAFLLRPSGDDRLSVALCTRWNKRSIVPLRQRSLPLPEALRQGEPIVSSGRQLRADHPEAVALGFGRFACVPVRTAGQLVAAIGAADPSDAPFRPEVLVIVETIAALLEAMGAGG